MSDQSTCEEKILSLENDLRNLKNKYELAQKTILSLEKTSDLRFKAFFDHIPISIWEEDFSEVYNYLESINFREIDDFESFLVDNPDVVNQCINRVVIIDFNEHSAKLYKLENKEDLITNFDKLFSESTFEAFKQELVAMQQGKTYLEMDAEIIDIEGQKHDIFLQWFVVPGFAEKFERVFITTIDVTELRKSEKERYQLIESFQQKQKLESLGLFAGGIAHDFKNILQGISGHAELAKLAKEEQNKVEYLDKILELTQKGAMITGQIQSYSGKNTQKIEIINLNKEIINISNLFTVLLDKKTELVLDLCKNKPLIEANTGQLNQVFLNLVSNSSDSIVGKTGKIIIETRIFNEPPDESKVVIISVIDNGKGIKPEEIPKIFDPFYSTKGDKRGLGLSVVHGIILSYGGHIDVKSVLGEGTTVKIFLPIHKISK